MLRALILATLVLVTPGPASAQAPSVLHIRVRPHRWRRRRRLSRAIRCSSAAIPRAPRPVDRDTSADGTADVELRPGNYTVESDRPVRFHGKAYQWTQTIDMVAGRDTVVNLTPDNAEIAASSDAGSSSHVGRGVQRSARGGLRTARPQMEGQRRCALDVHKSRVRVRHRRPRLMVTNQRRSARRSLSRCSSRPSSKSRQAVLARRCRARHRRSLGRPDRICALSAVPLMCKDDGDGTSRIEGQEIFALGVPVRHQDAMASGIAKRVSAHDIVSDLVLSPGVRAGPCSPPPAT